MKIISISKKEESINEQFPSKYMEKNFAALFEDISYEASLMLLQSLTDPDIKKQRKLTDHEMNIIKSIALEKLHWQIISKEYVAVHLLEQFFLFNEKCLVQIWKLKNKLF